MADGPAGLRVAKSYYINENGPQSTTGALPPTLIEYFPDDIKAWFMPKIPEDAKILEQYTTALPIGSALAQSWNREFAEICGDIVGTEMEMFNVNLWLAPALNIHRTILCGRNFEYYSEDPLISGSFASSITDVSKITVMPMLLLNTLLPIIKKLIVTSAVVMFLKEPSEKSI